MSMICRTHRLCSFVAAGQHRHTASSSAVDLVMLVRQLLNAALPSKLWAKATIRHTDVTTQQRSLEVETGTAVMLGPNLRAAGTLLKRCLLVQV